VQPIARHGFPPETLGKSGGGSENSAQDERNLPALATLPMPICPLHLFSHKKYAALGLTARATKIEGTVKELAGRHIVS
jgi:hypothetical protein